MTWRGSTTVSDRIFACLVYLLPILDLIVLVIGPLQRSPLGPFVNLIARPLEPLLEIYLGFGGIASFIIFFAIYLLVVRNENIRHFIRFNAMQAILFGIALSLIGIIARTVFGFLPPDNLLAQTLFNTIFLGAIAAIGFSIVQSAFGRYAEIPTISDAVYMQVR